MDPNDITVESIQLNQDRKIQVKLKMYKNLLRHCLNKIYSLTKNDPKIKVYTYEIPMNTSGLQECAVYINLQLQLKGFNTYFMQPNKVYISWDTPSKQTTIKEFQKIECSKINIPTVQSDAIKTLRMLRSKIKNEFN